jgi:outer membrane biosynthesis protein TonB
MEGGGKSMWGRFGQRARRSDVLEQAIDALVGALLVVEQARDALENVRGRFGRTQTTRHEGRAYGKLVGRGIAVLVLLTIIALAFRLLRRRAREESAPATTTAPEEGVEEATPPEPEVVPPGPPSAEDVPPREEPPPGEERPERRGGTPTAPPTPREEPPPGEERP